MLPTIRIVTIVVLYFFTLVEGYSQTSAKIKSTKDFQELQGKIIDKEYSIENKQLQFPGFTSIFHYIKQPKNSNTIKFKNVTISACCELPEPTTSEINAFLAITFDKCDIKNLNLSHQTANIYIKNSKIGVISADSLNTNEIQLSDNTTLRKINIYDSKIHHLYIQSPNTADSSQINIDNTSIYDISFSPNINSGITVDLQNDTITGRFTAYGLIADSTTQEELNNKTNSNNFSFYNCYINADFFSWMKSQTQLFLS